MESNLNDDVPQPENRPIPTVFRLIEGNMEAVAIILQRRGFFISEEEWRALPRRLKNSYTDVTSILQDYRKQQIAEEAEKSVQTKEATNESATTVAEDAAPADQQAA